MENDVKLAILGLALLGIMPAAAKAGDYRYDDRRHDRYDVRDGRGYDRRIEVRDRHDHREDRREYREYRRDERLGHRHGSGVIHRDERITIHNDEVVYDSHGHPIVVHHDDEIVVHRDVRVGSRHHQHDDHRHNRR
jgi:hypothetical protein